MPIKGVWVGVFMVDNINSLKNSASAAGAAMVSPSSPSFEPLFEEQDEENKAYELSFSEEGWKVLGDKEEKEEENVDKNKEEDGKTGEKKRDASGKEELTEEEQRQVDKLKKIDRETRTHEQAHLSAAGGYARGGAQYDYVTGPDGKRYANGGHVNLDTSPEKEPESTIRKANTIRKAALAPADPSPADRQIAADASQMAAEAQQELVQKRNQNGENKTDFIRLNLGDVG